MKRTLLATFMIIHGLLHVQGLLNTLSQGALTQLSLQSSGADGMLRLIAATLFLVSAVMLLLSKKFWWLPAAVAVIPSQILSAWHDNRWATIANVLVAIACISDFAAWNFKRKYRSLVKDGIRASTAPDKLLVEADLQELPDPVKRYLHYSGAVGKPVVRHFSIRFEGRIRKNARSAWMPFVSEQFNFMGATTRLFFMSARMKLLPVAGFHCFQKGAATMDIRLLSLFRVQYQAGSEMDISETVTFFNDMCCMAPATLIDKRITWLEENHNSVKAQFSNNGIRISAWLHFNEQGQLCNFISDDRFAAGDNHEMRRLRWSTPLNNYAFIDRRRLAGSAEAHYEYPEGDLCYGQFFLKRIEYNGSKFR